MSEKGLDDVLGNEAASNYLICFARFADPSPYRFPLPTAPQDRGLRVPAREGGRLRGLPGGREDDGGVLQGGGGPHVQGGRPPRHPGHRPRPPSISPSPFPLHPRTVCDCSPEVGIRIEYLDRSVNPSGG